MLSCLATCYYKAQRRRGQPLLKDMIGSKIVKLVVDGVLRTVQVITYSNGKTVKRVLDNNGIPQSILD